MGNHCYLENVSINLFVLGYKPPTPSNAEMQRERERDRGYQFTCVLISIFD